MGWAFVLLVYVSVVCKFSQNFIFLKVFFSGYFFPLELHFKKTFVLQFFPTIYIKISCCWSLCFLVPRTPLEVNQSKYENVSQAIRPLLTRLFSTKISKPQILLASRPL